MHFGTAICAIVKEPMPQRWAEWLAWHQAIGVEHIFVYDDNSQPPIVPSAGVTVWPARRQPDTVPQLDCYRHFLQVAAGWIDWVAFIDADEFLVPYADGDVPTLLATQAEDTGALALTWISFAGLGEPDAADRTERFLHPIEPDHPLMRHVKCIVRPAAVADWTNPHLPALRQGYRAQDPDGREVSGPIAGEPSQRAWLAHYYCGDRDEWLAKCWRGSACVQVQLPFHDPALWDRLNALAQAPDTRTRDFGRARRGGPAIR